MVILPAIFWRRPWVGDLPLSLRIVLIRVASALWATTTLLLIPLLLESLMLREPIISFNPQPVIVLLLLLRRVSILPSNILSLWNLYQLLSLELCRLDPFFCALFLLGAASVIEVGPIAFISFVLPLDVLVLA